MEAVIMGSSSPFPCLKLVSCRDHIFTKSLPIHHPCNTFKNIFVGFKFTVPLSSSCRGVRLSSSNTQQEVDNHEFLVEESSHGYTIETEQETETETEREKQTVRVKFQLQRECTFGQNFLIAGEDPLFGSWDPNNAIPMTWSDGHLWSVDLDIPIGKCIKFKFIMQESDGRFMWQPGPDRILECFETDKILTLCEDWGTPDFRRITETDPTLNQEIGMLVESSVRINGTVEEKGYPLNLKEVLATDEGFPVLVPGLSQFQSSDEPDTLNGATMVSAGADIPELDSTNKANAFNSNSRPDISSIHENQDSCDNGDLETKQVDQQQDHEDSQPMESGFRNDIQWGNNVMQKLLNFFGI